MPAELECCGLYVCCSVLLVGYGSEKCRPFKHRVCIILHPEKEKEMLWLKRRQREQPSGMEVPRAQRF